MKALFTIETENGGLFYTLFYFLAFLAGMIVLVVEGRKRKFEIISWLLVITTSFLFFMVGTQVVKFSADDWQRVLHFQALESRRARSVLGGVLLVIPGLLLAKYLLRFRYDLMDAFAWAMPVGMIVQRMGCFVAGCCYGTPTAMPWGIQYGNGSHAFHQHVQNNLIPSSSQLSLIIHPVALYEIVGCIMLIIMLYRIKRYLTVSGNLFLASLGLYAAVRLVTEFFRANSFGVRFQNELTIVQIVILALLPIIVLLVIYREKKSKNSLIDVGKPVSEKFALMYFLGISFLFLLVSKWLTSLEIVTLNLVMVPTLMFISWQVFKSFTVPAMRLGTLGLMVGSLVMMSQTLPEKSNNDSTRHAYNVISLGTSRSTSSFDFTDFVTTYQTVNGTDCNGNSTTYQTPVTTSTEYTLEETSNISGVGYTRVEQKNNKLIQYGADLYWGSSAETVNGLEIQSIPVAGIRPYFQNDGKLVGFGLGLHIGTLGKLSTPESNGTEASTNALRKISAFPSAYFRIGYVTRVFGEVKIGQQFPAPFPALAFQTSLGIGFKKNNGAALRIGTGSHAGLVLAPSIPIGRHFILEPQVAGFPGLFVGIWQGDLDDEVKQKSSFIGSLSLRYKFGRNMK